MTEEKNDKTRDKHEVLHEKHEPDASRRNFLKFGAVGAGAAAAAATGFTIVKRMEGIPHDEFPLPIRDEYKPVDQRDVILTFAHSKALQKKHPERIRKFENFDFYEANKAMFWQPPRKDPGYTEIEKALQIGGYSGVQGLIPQGIDGSNSGVLTWEQKMLGPQKYAFSSPQEASLAIKTAANLYGALGCGITPRDSRWDYQPMYDPIDKDGPVTWEKDFPFEPKSVIVFMVEMDFHAIATAPSWISDATVTNAYGNAAKLAGQMAVFIQMLGYRLWPP